MIDEYITTSIYYPSTARKHGGYLRIGLPAEFVGRRFSLTVAPDGRAVLRPALKSAGGLLVYSHGDKSRAGVMMWRPGAWSALWPMTDHPARLRHALKVSESGEISFSLRAWKRDGKAALSSLAAAVAEINRLTHGAARRRLCFKNNMLALR